MRLFKEKQTENKLDTLKKELDKIKSEEIAKADEYDIINFKMITGCGCGGSYTEAHAVVPKGMDTPFNHDNRFDVDDIDNITREYPGISIKEGWYHGYADNYDPSRYDDVF